VTSFAHSFYEINGTQIENDTNPLFRKATANMLAAYYACKKSVEALTDVQKSSLSFIVATSFGEVSSSLEFLTNLHDSKIAKPILFQNSLHNSTLGFVAIQLGLTGPALTISADANTDQAIGDTASALLHVTENVLVCVVDIVPAYLKENYLLSFPHLRSNLDWARSFVLSSQKPVNDKKIVTECSLLNFNCAEVTKCFY
jgi:hypothetical protein